jgi:DNA-binding response OmpR family regulator
MRLLVVEDNPNIRELLLELLDGAGYVVDGAANIEEALARLGRTAFDLLILDLELPDGDGRRVLRHLRRRGSAMPVIVCSGEAHDGACAALFDAGADACLPKPFSSEELLARVRALLRRAAEPEPIAAPARIAGFAAPSLTPTGATRYLQ